ncbi:hypothetical protein Poly21_00970 [Allorhodopirellula heiligendammensis]|uniref:Uncharacterized protein n=1 Tax=Allorhodopirellula heiligendammensis TaxID=2714739 RepID=A0A5C6C1F6_9BACT|nr:hypothetical protein [Allorhodopirellula heiligendammensis]TWU17945.1 hypothetical protein Poly21_00970 [Allorhodopirellula heiligendammensis]
MNDEQRQTVNSRPIASAQPGEVRLSTSWLSRRLRFQLTPLMDLLLIIVFAQFLDVRETSQRESTSLQAQREQLNFDIARQRSELAGIRDAMRSQQRELERQRDQARAARDQAVQRSDAKLAEMQGAMDLIGQWFTLDENAITRADSATGATALDDPIEAAVAQAQRLGQGSADAVIRFLIGHAELLKRAEIWTVHADENGNIAIEADQRSESFRLEAKTQAARTDEVTDRLFAAYKQFPQPKGLVILLVSFAPQSVAGVYQPLVDAIPKTLERLRADTPETRFEYTVLGATPDPM